MGHVVRINSLGKVCHFRHRTFSEGERYRPERDALIGLAVEHGARSDAERVARRDLVAEARKGWPGWPSRGAWRLPCGSQPPRGSAAACRQASKAGGREQGRWRRPDRLPDEAPTARQAAAADTYTR